MKDIKNYDTFVKIEPINKGWSNDKKYYIETKNGDRLLLRISDISEYEEKKYEFDIMKKIAKLDIKMSLPIDFGICNNGKNVYQILTWCDGIEAKELLPTLSENEQYEFGVKAGKMLKEMQKAESYSPSNKWAETYKRRVEKYIEYYKNCGERLEHDEILFAFLDEHFNCLNNRPMSLLHADFQSDNMIISPNNELYVIDFQGSGIVDPYYALTGIMVTAEVSTQFANGQLHSYFGSKVPNVFWELNSFYMIAESINAFSVTVKLGKEEIEYSNEMNNKMLEWFDNFNNLIPSWYVK